MNWAYKLKFHHLKMMISISEQGNLTQAATLLNISQPALSKWLSALEEEIGFLLFERHSKGLRPSAGGKRVLEHAQRLLNDMERSCEDIERFKQGAQGSLAVGCSPVATDCVAQAMLGLSQKHPAIHLQVIENVMTPLLQDLLDSKLDVVVGRIGGRALQLPLNYRVLYTEPVCFIAGCHHPLASKTRLHWDELTQFSWVVWPTGTPIRVSINDALVAKGMRFPAHFIESTSTSVTLNLLQASDMISILSLRLAERYAEKGLIKILNLPRLEQQGSVGVFWRQNDIPSDALQSFIHQLVEAS